MNRHIGYSTGALAKQDFIRGTQMLRQRRIPVVELSALRDTEVIPLIDALNGLDLSFATHISFHAPSQFRAHTEPEIAQLLRRLLPRRWPIIIHPDVQHDLLTSKPE